MTLPIPKDINDALLMKISQNKFTDNNIYTAGKNAITIRFL